MGGNVLTVALIDPPRPRPPLITKRNAIRTSQGRRRRRRGIARTEIERASDLLLLEEVCSVSTLVSPPSLPPDGVARSFRRLKRHCFQGRRRRRENQLRPLELPTDGGGIEGFERVACAVRCRAGAVPTYYSSSLILWNQTYDKIGLLVYL